MQFFAVIRVLFYISLKTYSLDSIMADFLPFWFAQHHNHEKKNSEQSH